MVEELCREDVDDVEDVEDVEDVQPVENIILDQSGMFRDVATQTTIIAMEKSTQVSFKSVKVIFSHTPFPQLLLEDNRIIYILCIFSRCLAQDME